MLLGYFKEAIINGGTGGRLRMKLAMRLQKHERISRVLKKKLNLYLGCTGLYCQFFEIVGQWQDLKDIENVT